MPGPVMFPEKPRAQRNKTESHHQAVLVTPRGSSPGRSKDSISGKSGEIKMRTFDQSHPGDEIQRLKVLVPHVCPRRALPVPLPRRCDFCPGERAWTSAGTSRSGNVLRADVTNSAVFSLNIAGVSRVYQATDRPRRRGQEEASGVRGAPGALCPPRPRPRSGCC